MIRILLAEDDTSMREYLARALQRVGYEVVPVGCGTEAMPLLESQRFDLLLTDIVMPEMDGIELAQKASAIDPAIRGKVRWGREDPARRTRRGHTRCSTRSRGEIRAPGGSPWQQSTDPSGPPWPHQTTATACL